MMSIRLGAILCIFVCLAGLRAAAAAAVSKGLPAEEGLAYFGFAVVDCGWDDPHDGVPKTNYVDEVSGFSNIAQMCVYSADDFIQERIDLFQAAGIKAILHVEAILFKHAADASSPSGSRATLRANAQENWLQFVQLNGDLLTTDNIAALYIVDEPIWNGVNRQDFEHALDIIKATVPNIPTLSIEAYPVLDQIWVPEQLDWIGFDRYDTADPANDPAWLADLETVRAARTRADQKLVIVASTQWLPYYLSDGGLHPADMEAVIISYYQVATMTDNVVALVGYLWPGGLDDPQQLGVRGLPKNVRRLIHVLGRRILLRLK